MIPGYADFVRPGEALRAAGARGDRSDPGERPARPVDGGVVLYQMLAGRPPFWSEKDSYLEIVLGHLSELPRALNEVNPSVSPQMTQIVMRTLEKDPALRPTAKELLKELMRLMRRTTGQHDTVDHRSAEAGASSSPSLQPISAMSLSPSAKSQPPGVPIALATAPTVPTSVPPPARRSDASDFEEEDTGVALPTAVTIEIDQRLIDKGSGSSGSSGS
ncbi:MAG: hypothetical protein U1A78_12930 [Polyangia bacterium]